MVLTLDQYIAGGSSIAALATALATFWTIREIAKQRKAAVRPDLISERQYAYVYSERPVSCLRHTWSRGKLEQSQVLQHSSYGVALLNVGAGAAKAIRTEWTIDIASMVANVNVLARNASMAVSAEIIPGESEIRILWPDKVVGHQLVANQLQQDLGHLLPTSQGDNELQVHVPSSYLALTSLQIALGLAAGQLAASASQWLELPSAHLTIRYADVHGQRHVKQLLLVLTLLGAGHEGIAHTSGQLPTFMQFMLNLDEA